MKSMTLTIMLAACSSHGTGHSPPPPSRDDAGPAGSNTGTRATAAAADAAQPGAGPTPIEHRVTCGDVTAIWRGERDEGLDEYEELWFEVGQGTSPIKMPTGGMFVSDWSFDIFSPDCKHVLLLYSHDGPYHIVRTARLAEYLRGGKPDHVLAGKPDPEGVTGTSVFHDGAWLSNNEVSYQWGCCDPPITTRFKLPAGR